MITPNRPNITILSQLAVFPQLFPDLAIDATFPIPIPQPPTPRPRPKINICKDIMNTQRQPQNQPNDNKKPNPKPNQSFNNVIYQSPDPNK